MRHRPPTADPADVVDATSATLIVGATEQTYYRTDTLATALQLDTAQAVKLLRAVGEALDEALRYDQPTVHVLLQGERPGE
jgi:hypothetical protein